MTGSPKVFVETNFHNEMYNCIENQCQTTQPTSTQPQHAAFNSSNPPIGARRASPNGIGNGHDPSVTPAMQSPQSYSDKDSHNGHHSPPTSNKNMHRFEIAQHRGSYSDDEKDDYFENPISGVSDSNDDHYDRPSNSHLLGTAFCSFMGFAVVQTFVAVLAKSEAMVGDSMAMIVDALTYLFNWYAERKKSQFDEQEYLRDCYEMQQQQQDPVTRQRILERTRRKMVLQMELVPPLISVSTLIVVTAVVLRKSIHVLILDTHRKESLQGNPNIHIMMYFSIANLGLDLINVANFAKAKHLFGYETNDHPQVGHTAMAVSVDESESSNHEDEENFPASPASTSSKFKPTTVDMYNNPKDYDEDQDHTANLNMCSAYTHVFADTLRSIAVLVAASLSELVEEITPEEADASAAVVVSALILLSLIPLFKGLIHTSNELRMIIADEKSDEILLTL